MDSDLHSPSDSAGAKAAFHKPSNDPSNRKYRRRSPLGGSSSSDGEHIRERSSTPTHSLDNTYKLNENRQIKDTDDDHKRSRYSRDSNRINDRRSYNDRRHDDYKRRDKYTDQDHKNFHPRTKGSYSDHSRREFEQNRSRDDVDKHSRDRSDGSAHRSNRDKDKDRGHRSGHYHKDASRRDCKEVDDSRYTRGEKGKSYDQETRGVKDKYFKEPKEVVEDKSVLVAKKSKFSLGKDTDYTKDASKHVAIANEVQSSSSKQDQEFVDKTKNSEQEFVKDSDIDAAKIAAMKAAELVNRNLIGTGVMSTDQKKKLLWGSKKTTPAEEAAHRWDTSMFSDRERQEKFNKLMGVKGELKKKVEDKDDSTLAEKQKELQMDLEKQYTAGLRRRDGRTVGLGL